MPFFRFSMGGERGGGGGAGELPRILWTMPKNLLVT